MSDVIPEYTLTGESFKIPGRGLVITARLLQRTPSAHLKRLIGQPVDWDGNVWTISGVESFAINEQDAGNAIGLLIRPYFGESS